MAVTRQDYVRTLEVIAPDAEGVVEVIVRAKSPSPPGARRFDPQPWWIPGRRVRREEDHHPYRQKPSPDWTATSAFLRRMDFAEDLPSLQRPTGRYLEVKEQDGEEPALGETVLGEPVRRCMNPDADCPNPRRGNGVGNLCEACQRYKRSHNGAHRSARLVNRARRRQAGGS